MNGLWRLLEMAAISAAVSAKVYIQYLDRQIDELIRLKDGP